MNSPSPCRTGRTLQACALVPLILIGLAAGPAGAAERTAAVSNSEAALIARATYGRLSELTTASGHPVAFQLSGFQTHDRNALAGLPWLDAATMPGGRMIDVARDVRQSDYLGVAGVIYRPSWSQGDRAWARSDEGAALAGLSAAEVLARLAAGPSPDLAGATAVTTFRVTATLDGTSRSYRAAFLWLPNPSAGERAFLPVDHVTQGVEESAREPLPALRFADLLRLDGIDDALAAPPSSATCSSWSSPTTQGYHSEGSANHAWGKHEGNASFKITCSCNSTCASTCTATIPSASCTDSGFSEMCHKMASSLNANTDRKDNGNLTAAACGAGYGCVKKSCLFCVCGLGVSVGISGATVNFTPSGSPDWTGNLQYTRTCAKCT